MTLARVTASSVWDPMCGVATNVRKGQETAVGRWFFGICIESGSCDVAGTQGVVERVFVYQIASGRVDQKRRPLHRLKPIGIDEAARSRRRWCVEGHDVGRGEQLLKTDAADPDPANASSGSIGS